MINNILTVHDIRLPLCCKQDLHPSEILRSVDGLPVIDVLGQPFSSSPSIKQKKLLDP